MKQYLVTGGAGSIGSHLVDHLVTLGRQVRVLDDLSTGRPDNLPPQANLIVADAFDAPALAGAAGGCDGIFHLAAIALLGIRAPTIQWMRAQSLRSSS